MSPNVVCCCRGLPHPGAGRLPHPRGHPGRGVQVLPVRGLLRPERHRLDLPDDLPAVHRHHDGPRHLPHRLQEGGHVPPQPRGLHRGGGPGHPQPGGDGARRADPLAGPVDPLPHHAGRGAAGAVRGAGAGAAVVLGPGAAGQPPHLLPLAAADRHVLQRVREAEALLPPPRGGAPLLHLHHPLPHSRHRPADDILQGVRAGARLYHRHLQHGLVQAAGAGPPPQPRVRRLLPHRARGLQPLQGAQAAAAGLRE